MIKDFNEYIKEKFDYKKQGTHFDWTSLKKYDIFYTLDEPSYNIQKLIIVSDVDFIGDKFEISYIYDGDDDIICTQINKSDINDKIVVDKYGDIFGYDYKMLFDLSHNSSFIELLKEYNRKGTIKSKREFIKDMLKKYKTIQN